MHLVKSGGEMPQKNPIIRSCNILICGTHEVWDTGAKVITGSGFA